MNEGLLSLVFVNATHAHDATDENCMQIQLCQVLTYFNALQIVINVMTQGVPRKCNTNLTT